MGWVVNATPRPLDPRERPGTHCTGGWVGHRTDLDGCGKSRPRTGFDPRAVQPYRVAISTELSRPTLIHIKTSYFNDDLGMIFSSQQII